MAKALAGLGGAAELLQRRAEIAQRLYVERPQLDGAINVADMLAAAENRPELKAPLGAAGDIGAQILFAVREEMALTLSDAVMRRTSIGQLGAPSRDALEAASRIMAGELLWSEERRRSEIASLAPWFQTREAA